MTLLQKYLSTTPPVKKHWLFRYGLSLVLFAATVGLSILLSDLNIKINLTLPVVGALVAAVWYGGRGPGLLISVLFEATTIIYTPIPPDSSVAKAAFGYFSVLALYIFIVLVIGGLQKARDGLRVRERQQAAVARFGQDALSMIPLDALLPKATELVRETLDVDHTAVCELTPDQDMLCYSAGAGLDEDVIGFEFSYSAERSLAGRVLETGQPIVVRDLRKDDSFETSRVLEDHSVRSVVAVEILHRERSYGVLGAFDKQPRVFSADDVNFLQSIANIIAEAAARLSTEESVREQRGWLQTTLSSIGEGVIATDREGNVTFMNPVAEEMTGWAASEARGLPLDDVFYIINEKTRERIQTPVAKVIEDGMVVGLANHTILRSRHGVEIPIDDSAAPIKDGDEVAGVVLVFSNVTERKRAETVSATLAAIVASSSDAIISKDLNGIIKSWNQGAEQVFGYTAEEAIGRSVTMLMPEDRINEEPGILSRIRRGEEIDHYETIRRRKDGQLLDISLNVSPVVDAQGRIIGASKIARDITERKAAEQARREREIMQRLVEAQEAERHRIARDLHDHLGQKMTALRLQIEVLTESVRDEAVGSDVAALQKSAFQIDRDIGFLSWELRPTELEDLGLVDALRSFVREWSSQYGIIAEFHTTSSEAGRYKERLDASSETSLYRIVQEALNNILKHANAQNVNVLLHHREDHIVLIIEDDGRGFERERLTSNGNGNGKGAKLGGLGLVGMRERVALLNGTLEIDTAPGKGTTIHARIPLHN